MTPEQIERFERTKEMNLSFGRRDLGNFRVNIFWQRGSIAIVVRYIAGDIPRLETLGLPSVLNEVIMEKRGLVLVVGATGSGKSTITKEIARLVDQIKAEKVPVIFGSEVFPSKVLEQIAAETGARYEDTLRDDDLPEDRPAPPPTLRPRSAWSLAKTPSSA